MQSKALNKYLCNLLTFSFHEHNVFVGNKIVLETSSVAITDTSSVQCFDQLTNIYRFARFETSHIILKNSQVGLALSILHPVCVRS